MDTSSNGHPEAPARRKVHVIGIHAYRGDAGKATLAANLAYLVARTSAEVAVLDTDLQAPELHILSVGFPGEPAIHLEAGELYLSATQCVGGKGGMACFAGGDCNPPGAGGPGLLAEGGQVRVRDVVLAGGAGGDPSLGGCPSGLDDAAH